LLGETESLAWRLIKHLGASRFAFRGRFSSISAAGLGLGDHRTEGSSGLGLLGNPAVPSGRVETAMKIFGRVRHLFCALHNDSRIMNTDCERKQYLFDAARELTDPAQQRALLEAGCGGDLTLLGKMEKLLRAGEQAEEFFADCIPSSATLSVALEADAVIPPAARGRTVVGGIGPNRF